MANDPRWHKPAPSKELMAGEEMRRKARELLSKMQNDGEWSHKFTSTEAILVYFGQQVEQETARECAKIAASAPPPDSVWGETTEEAIIRTFGLSEKERS